VTSETEERDSTMQQDTTALMQLLTSVLQHDTVTALSFTDPWGTAVAIGAKKMETRSWPAPRKYWRGPLALHISGTLTAEAKWVCERSPFREVLHAAGYASDMRRRFMWELPLKQVIAIAWLEEAERISADFHVDEQERSFGNYLPGRYAWKFGAVYRLKQPVLAVGRLGLWQWTPAVSVWDEIQQMLDGLRAEGQVESHA